MNYCAVSLVAEVEKEMKDKKTKVKFESKFQDVLMNILPVK